MNKTKLNYLLDAVIGLMFALSGPLSWGVGRGNRRRD